MPCNQCGDCLYASESTADLHVSITSGGVPVHCRPDHEILHAAVPYQTPGEWARTLADGQTVLLRSRCITGVWTWSAPVLPPGGSRGPQPPDCNLAGEDLPGDPSRNDCGGFEQIIVTLLPNGGWIRTQTTITIRNNQLCA